MSGNANKILALYHEMTTFYIFFQYFIIKIHEKNPGGDKVL